MIDDNKKKQAEYQEDGKENREEEKIDNSKEEIDKEPSEDKLKILKKNYFVRLQK